MTARAEFNARTGRALSAVLQGVLAQQMTASDDAAVNAFLLEYAEEITVASASGVEGYADLLIELVGDLSGAIASVSEYVAARTGQTQIELLTELVRTYRKAGRP